MWPDAAGGVACLLPGQPGQAQVWRWHADRAPTAGVEPWHWPNGTEGVAAPVLTGNGVVGAVWLLPPVGQAAPHWVPPVVQMAAGRLRDSLKAAEAVAAAVEAVARVAREIAAGMVHRCNNVLTGLEIHRALAARHVPSQAARHMEGIRLQVAVLTEVLQHVETLAASGGTGPQRPADIGDQVRTGLALYRRLPHMEVELGSLPDTAVPSGPVSTALILAAVELAASSAGAAEPTRLSISGSESGDGSVTIELALGCPVESPPQSAMRSDSMAVAARLIGLAGGSFRVSVQGVAARLPAVVGRSDLAHVQEGPGRRR